MPHADGPVCQPLILAPFGRDGDSIAKVLGAHGMVPRVMASAALLAEALDDDTGALLLTSEALHDPGLPVLLGALQAQPSWSDLPIVFLSARSTGPARRVEASRRTLPAGMSNAMLMERPLSGESLVSAMKWALGMRQRQFLVRDQFAALTLRTQQLQASEAAERRAARRREFILVMSQAQRDMASPQDIISFTASALAAHLNLHRVGFYRVDDTGSTIHFAVCHASQPLAPLLGTLETAALGPTMVDLLRRGHNVISDHIPSSPLADSALSTLGVVSVIGVPLMRQGRWVGGAYVHQGAHRLWTTEDVLLVEEVARLTWDSVDRAESLIALAESEVRLQGMIDSIDQMVWSTLPDGHHDYYNERWYQYTGVPRGTTDGEAWNGVFHPDDQPRAWALWRHSLNTGEPYYIEYRLRHHSGQYRWVLGRAQPVHDPHGRIVRWFGTCTDIQDIVDAREVLARSHDELSRQVSMRTQERDRIWQVSQDLLGVADDKGVWLSVNPAWTRTLGWPASEIIGRTSEWLEHPDDLIASRAEIARLTHGQATVSFENRLKRRGGGYCVLSWRAVAMDGKLYCVARDLTEQRSQQAALAQAEDHLRQAQKMEAVGQLTGGIAHDFNNMLQGVTSALFAVKKFVAQEQFDRIPKMVTLAERSAFKAAALTHRLLAFSRRQPLDTRPLDLNALVISLEELLLRTLGENIELRFDLAHDLWEARCDANQLENSLLNLVINARGALPHGGRVTIRTFNAPSADALAVRSGKAGDFICVEVADTGTGMTPDVLARAFEPFFTTKPLGEGTGLGLSMIYGFAQQTGGACLIDSELGQGTTVKLLMPRNDPLAAPAGAAPWMHDELHPVPSESGAHGSILVVEDEQTVRELVIEALKEQGLTVMGAADSVQALALFDTGMRFNLLITDIGLPGLNGRQLADIARQRQPGLAVLLMTGYAESVASGQGQLPVGMSLITKPFDMGLLLKMVHQLLAPAAA